MSMEDLFLKIQAVTPEESNPEPPYEVIARYTRSEWIGADGSVNYLEKFLPLKRRSHPQAVSDFHECITEGSPLEVLPSMESGKIYRITCEITSRDFETGHPDEWHWVVSNQPV